MPQQGATFGRRKLWSLDMPTMARIYRPTLFRIILDRRMMTSKTEILLLSSGTANVLVFLGFPKIFGTMCWLFACLSGCLPIMPQGRVNPHTTVDRLVSRCWCVRREPQGGVEYRIGKQPDRQCKNCRSNAAFQKRHGFAQSISALFGTQFFIAPQKSHLRKK